MALPPQGLAYTFNAPQSAMDTHLELIPATRIGAKYPNGTFKSEWHFLDFVLDGQSLWERVGKPNDMVSILCVEYAVAETIQAVNRLLLVEKPNLPNGRRLLFICSECGDIGCGAVTAMVTKVGDSIMWAEFGYENNYENHVILDDYLDVGPFTFNALEYERTLFRAIEKLRTGASGSRVDRAQ
jgi:hypothetical protein